ncbi:MAG: DUF2887 domain-containing protein [Nostoc sp. CmiVER01]|uniref:DUF2887 domain-containing protein n=1 Tax=Nostoc sp. CmiVER01 TaxID=3075384 RepID=UPI002AD4B74C|nr:DUF2887 domain-containing protein [Nostoc sp. CmiVER01]MDZ8123238.1 DUF2887 domain-containing protein [Nostoc sp. CmiVER01]
MLIVDNGCLTPSSSSITRALLLSGQVRRVYLDELGDLRQQPLGLGLMLLTNVTSETEAVEGARFLLEEAEKSRPVVVFIHLNSRLDYANMMSWAVMKPELVFKVAN